VREILLAVPGRVFLASLQYVRPLLVRHARVFPAGPVMQLPVTEAALLIASREDPAVPEVIPRRGSEDDHAEIAGANDQRENLLVENRRPFEVSRLVDKDDIEA
jgi:hypothetical protein